MAAGNVSQGWFVAGLLVLAVLGVVWHDWVSMARAAAAEAELAQARERAAKCHTVKAELQATIKSSSERRVGLTDAQRKLIEERARDSKDGEDNDWIEGSKHKLVQTCMNKLKLCQTELKSDEHRRGLIGASQEKKDVVALDCEKRLVAERKARKDAVGAARSARDKADDIRMQLFELEQLAKSNKDVNEHWVAMKNAHASGKHKHGKPRGSGGANDLVLAGSGKGVFAGNKAKTQQSLADAADVAKERAQAKARVTADQEKLAKAAKHKKAVAAIRLANQN